MTVPTPPASPADEPVAPVAVAARGHRAVQVTAILGLLGIVLALVGLGLGARPLRTETQDCGTAASFLLDGRVNVLVDPADPPKGTTKAEAEANNDDPCQERAANRAWPAAGLVVGGALLGIVAVVVELAVRVVVGRRRSSPAPPGLGAPAPAVAGSP